MAGVRVVLLAIALLNVSPSASRADAASDVEAQAIPASTARVARTLAIAPLTATLVTGQTQQFTATVRDQLGSVVSGVAVTWRVRPSALGTIDTRGVFTAGTVARRGIVTARSGTLSVSAEVTVVMATRSTADRPDDIAGPQLHIVYALPSDRADRALDTNGTLARSVESFQLWLERQTGGRRLRLDTYNGLPDISFYRFAKTDAQIRSFDPYMVTVLGGWLAEAGFDGFCVALAGSCDKIYLIYYDGSSAYSCGGGEWPGRHSAMYLHGQDVRGGPRCDTNSFTLNVRRPGYYEYGMLHEVFHNLGAASTCAPHHVLPSVPPGHVADSSRDLMYAGSQPWRIDLGLVLDKGRDDYYGHSNPNCLDLADSEFLTQPRP